MRGDDSDIPGGTIRTLASPTPATATSARGKEKRLMKSTTRCGESQFYNGVQRQAAAMAMNKAKNVGKAALLTGEFLHGAGDNRGLNPGYLRPG